MITRVTGTLLIAGGAVLIGIFGGSSFFFISILLHFEN